MTVNMEKPYVVGMDIGGTNTVFGVVDSRGNVLASDSIKTQEYDEIEAYVDAVCKKLIPLLQQFGGAEKFKGMGVGAPNGNYYKGTIEFAPNLPWKGVIPLFPHRAPCMEPASPSACVSASLTLSVTIIKKRIELNPVENNHKESNRKESNSM